MLPISLPEGWQVSEVHSDSDEEGVSFTLRVTKGTSMLNFLTTNEGIGDPPGGLKRTLHQHPEMGEIQVEHEEDGDFLSDWLEVQGGWAAVGGRDVPDTELDLLVSLLAVN